MIGHASRRHRSQGFLRLPARAGGAAAARREPHPRALATSRTAASSGSASPRPISARFRGEAEPFGALMPASMAPSPGRRGTVASSVLVEETELPLIDESADRILLVHMLEWSEKPRELLRELWRVLAPNGRLLLIVVPTAGACGRDVDTTPFGYGSPFSRRAAHEAPEGGDVLAGGLGICALYAALQLARPAADGRCSGSGSGSCCGRPSPA